MAVLSIDHPYHRHETVDLKGVKLASFRKRLNAFALDWALIFVPYLAYVAIVTVRRSPALRTGPRVADPNFTYPYLMTFVVFVVYFTLVTYFLNGQTLGKRRAGIRVIPLFRDRLTLWQCFERALGYSASSLELGFGFFQYFIHPNRQTVHDRIAETLVITDNGESRPLDAGVRR